MTWDPTVGALTDPWPAYGNGYVAAIDLSNNVTVNFNAVQGAIAGMLAPPFMSAATTVSGTGLSIATSTFTTITGWTSARDTASGLASGSTYFLNKVGLWEMTAFVSFTGNATGRRIINAAIGGTGATLLDGNSQIEGWTDAASGGAYGVWHILVTTAGTGTVVVQGWQSSGGSLTVGNLLNNKWSMKYLHA